MDSLTKTKVRDEMEVEYDDEPDVFGPWSTMNYQLAGLADLLQDNIRAVIAAGGGEAPPEPTRTPRPQPKSAKTNSGQKKLTAEEAEGVFAWFEDIREQFESQ